MSSAGKREDLLAPFRPGVDGSRFGYEEAARLLMRVGFGACQAEVEAAVEAGLESTLKRVFEPEPEPVDRRYERLLALGDRLARRDDLEGLRGHWFLRLIRAPRPLAENLTLFWHDHFATAQGKVRDLQAMHLQNRLFLDRGLAAFPELLAKVAKDPAMLVWLDNAASSKRHPNENFARELFELFSLGIGHYEEADVREAARAFTGWQVSRGRFLFRVEAHDEGNKRILGRQGPLGGEDVIDLCCEQPACARLIATKLYRRFVSRRIDEALAVSLGIEFARDELRIGRFLRRLLGSQLFFAEARKLALIRTPVQLMVGALRSLDASAGGLPLARHAAAMGQNLFEPPSVAGWEHGRAWINSATMLARHNFAAAVAEGEEGELCFRHRSGSGLAPDAVARSILGYRLEKRVLAGLVERVGEGVAAVAGAVLALPEAQMF